jgi:hypothetical protein
MSVKQLEHLQSSPEKKGRITRVRVESDRREVEKTRIWRTFNQALSPGCNDGGTKARIWRTFVDQVLSK